jgi:hypothetical protein
MVDRRKIEVFSAGCPTCNEAIKAVRGEACPSCEVIVLNMMDARVFARAKALGIRSVPAVVIDGKLASCCAGRGVDIEVLKAAGLGKAR